VGCCLSSLITGDDFFHTPLHSIPPFWGSCRSIAIRIGTKKLEWWVHQKGKKFKDVYSFWFNTWMWRTPCWTDRRTLHNGFFLSRGEACGPFIYQCWGLPHGLAQCASRMTVSSASVSSDLKALYKSVIIIIIIDVLMHSIVWQNGIKLLCAYKPLCGVGGHWCVAIDQTWWWAFRSQRIFYFGRSLVVSGEWWLCAEWSVPACSQQELAWLCGPIIIGRFADSCNTWCLQSFGHLLSLDYCNNM